MSAIERLQMQSDRQKVNAWLDHINEHDEACRNEVLEQCASDKEARQYFVSRYMEECHAV